MGTRADFYIGRGEKAEWLGSRPFDGYPDGIAKTILSATDEKLFREEVSSMLQEKRGTTPDMGWPWPWEDSRTTDYAYAFDGGKVWASSFGHEWFDPLKDEPEGDTPRTAVFPDMTAIQKVTLGPRSGLIVFGFK